MANNQVALVTSKDNVRSIFSNDKLLDQMRDVIPKHLTPERMVKMALKAVSMNEKLLSCTKQSFIFAVMQASQLGLDCSGTLGEGYLVPFRNTKLGVMEVQFIPGYQGLINLARRSGKVSRIEAHAIYEKDKYEIVFGLDPKLNHTPYLGYDRGDVIAAYMVAELVDGTKQVEVMIKSEIEDIRKKSKQPTGQLWKDNYSEACRKTVVRRGFKYLPKSTEIEKVLEYDNEVSGIDFDNLKNITLESEPSLQSTTDALAARLTNGKQESDSIPAEEPETPPEPKEKPKTGAEKLAEAKAANKRREERLAKEKQDARAYWRRQKIRDSGNC